MVYVLDAFALVALFLDEPAADEVESLLRTGTGAVSAVDLCEVVDQLGRGQGRDLEDLRMLLEPVIIDSLGVLETSEEIAWRAAAVRRRHYRRRGSELSLADCVALASASSGDRLATADPPLARAARAEAIEVVALPASDARRP